MHIDIWPIRPWSRGHAHTSTWGDHAHILYTYGIWGRQFAPHNTEHAPCDVMAHVTQNTTISQYVQDSQNVQGQTRARPGPDQSPAGPPRNGMHGEATSQSYQLRSAEFSAVDITHDVQGHNTGMPYYAVLCCAMTYCAMTCCAVPCHESMCMVCECYRMGRMPHHANSIPCHPKCPTSRLSPSVVQGNC